MNKKQKGEMLEVFADGFHEVVAPILENIQERIITIESKMATKDDAKELSAQIDSLDRKFEAQQDRLDRQGKDIDTLKHKFATT